MTGYAEEAAVMPAGEQRAQNLKMLVQKAWDYEKTSYRGLFNFIRYIENLQKYDVDYGEAQSLGENRNVVQIMSIHRSKGLEFPVVFLGGLEKQFNKMDTRSRMVLDADLGIGFDMVDPVLRVRRTTLFKRCIQAKVNDDNIGEEIRVLYVALTRAKEKLILTGAVSGLEKKLERWCQSASPLKYGLSYQILSGAGGYLDLLMPVLLKYESARELLGEKGEIRPLREEEDAVWTTPVAIRKLSVQDLLAGGVEQEARKALDIESLRLLRSDEIYEPEFHEILGKRMAEAEEQHYQRIPVKLTVSQLKRQSEAELETESELLYGEESKKEADWEDWERIFEDSLFKEQTDLKTGTEEALPGSSKRSFPGLSERRSPRPGSGPGNGLPYFLTVSRFHPGGEPGSRGRAASGTERERAAHQRGGRRHRLPENLMLLKRSLGAADGEGAAGWCSLPGAAFHLCDPRSPALPGSRRGTKALDPGSCGRLFRGSRRPYPGGLQNRLCGKRRGSGPLPKICGPAQLLYRGPGTADRQKGEGEDPVFRPSSERVKGKLIAF